MRCSLIVTTYNWPEALAASLHSAFRQVVLPDEIIVADDGSGPATRELIAGLATKSPVPLIHSWQEDLGFRAAMSRNRAIARARGDYLVMIDGDMVLDPHFLADHLHWAAPGCFVQGSRVILDPARSALVKARPDQGPRWYQSGVSNRINGLRLPWLADQVARRACKHLKGIRTCNFALHRQDAYLVNGFNEAFVGWGREDSEFCVRLMNKGIQRRNLKFSGIAYHLHHQENARAALPANDRLLQDAIALKRDWCEQGLNGYPDSPPGPAHR